MHFPAAEPGPRPRRPAVDRRGDGDDDDSLLAQVFPAAPRVNAAAVAPAVLAAVKRMHQNLGHPDNRALVRALIICGAF